jgi:hypothetical protein
VHWPVVAPGVWHQVPAGQALVEAQWFTQTPAAEQMPLAQPFEVLHGEPAGWPQDPLEQTPAWHCAPVVQGLPPGRSATHLPAEQKLPALQSAVVVQAAHDPALQRPDWHVAFALHGPPAGWPQVPLLQTPAAQTAPVVQGVPAGLPGWHAPPEQ